VLAGGEVQLGVGGDVVEPGTDDPERDGPQRDLGDEAGGSAAGTPAPVASHTPAPIAAMMHSA